MTVSTSQFTAPSPAIPPKPQLEVKSFIEGLPITEGLVRADGQIHIDAINAGCNDVHLTNHLNVDIDPYVNPDLLCSVTDMEKHIKGTVHHIYAGHLLEHLTFEQGQAFLESAKRLLAPHGVLTVVIPDWRKAQNYPTQEAQGIILGLGQHVRLIDQHTLIEDVKMAGFTEVHAVDPENLDIIIHPKEKYQSAVIAINHPKCKWTYAMRSDGTQYNNGVFEG